MRIYNMELVVRSNRNEGPEGVEWITKVAVLASEEHVARRRILQDAYRRDMLVSQFLNVTMWETQQ